MPSFASILNIGQNVPNQEAIQLYFTTQSSDVGMALHDKTTDSNNPAIVQSSAADPPGNLVFSSQLASSMFMYFNAVFGFTKQLDPKSTKIDVSLVCPVYQPLATTESTNTTIASCSSPDKTWVYYLSGVDQNSVRIVRSEIGKQVTSITLEVNDVRLGSSLAAYFDAKKQHSFVIYQHEVEGDNSDVRQLYEYSVDEESSSRIQNTDDAAKLTSIAAVDFRQVTYLYYMNNDNELRVIRKEQGTWGSPAAVEAPNVNGSSQITVVSSGEANHVFYTDQNDSPVHLMLPY
ncbi:hypothetical protein ED733_002661 [Metarhizium rileyi]|uniref:Fucose-specific lectin n=1 Tax=Metarhizium rileyi (strain RCEF 4871) TaxID=1649241 RepID=A0A5C6FZP2_METRR|nr:hypothetical protein ED733_002661 [Metarhizium rileyi]